MEPRTKEKISKKDKEIVLNVIWDLRRRIQFLDDTHTADKILEGIYLVEREIESLGVE